MIKQMSGQVAGSSPGDYQADERQVSCDTAGDYQADERQVSCGSARDYHADERARVALLIWLLSSR